MIILSQDKKTILNFNNVSFLDIDESNGNYYVMANFDSIYETMGIYPTEERAKEVLEVIFDFFEVSQRMCNSDFFSERTFTYKMPEK